MDNSHDAESAQQLLHQHSHSQQSHTMIVEQELEAEQQEKLHVLYDNASTATLNSVQNFSSAAYGNKVGVSSAGDATFEPLSVDADAPSGSISGLIQQDGHFLHVDSSANLCDDDSLYLTDSTTGQQLTYIVTQPGVLTEDPNKERTISIDGTVQPDQSANHGAGGEETMLVRTDNSCADIVIPAQISTHSGGNVRTELVPAAALELDPEKAKNYQGVTVTLLNNEGEAAESEVRYLLLVSNDDNSATSVSDTMTANVISITEQNTASVSGTVESADQSHSTLTAAQLLTAAASQGVSITPQYTQVQVDLDSGQCSFCDYKTNQRHLLHKHIKTHSEDRPHKCHICGNGFKSAAALTNHLNAHSGIRPHKCKACESAFTTSGELMRHVRYKHTFEKPHKCTVCDYASVELSKMKRHMRCHTGERPYKCTECSYASPDSYKLKRHMRTHTGERPYACDLCPLRFTQSNSLKAHRQIHTGNKPVFQCQLCPTTCGRKTDLKIHMQKLHNKEKASALRCRKCLKNFDDRYNYKLHMKTHEGEKTYSCGLCEFATLTERKLEKHIILQHENHRPYKCDEEGCEAEFRYRSLLRRHKIFQHGSEDFHPLEKSHVCTCGKKFTILNNQLRHQELHAGNAVISSVLIILNDIVDIDEIGEDITAEICEEIDSSNPHLRDPSLASTSIALKPDTVSSTGSRARYSDIGDNSITQRITLSEEVEENTDASGNDVMVMRRIVQEVNGHRVVVMEVGPSDIDLNTDHEPGDSNRLSDDHGDTDFVSGESISQDAAVQILYNLAAENHLTASQNQDLAADDHHHTGDMTAPLSPPENVVTLEMESLPDDVMSVHVEEVTEESHELEDQSEYYNQSELDTISLSEQAASTTLMQLKRSTIEQQTVTRADGRPTRTKRRKIKD